MLVLNSIISCNSVKVILSASVIIFIEIQSFVLAILLFYNLKRIRVIGLSWPCLCFLLTTIIPLY